MRRAFWRIIRWCAYAVTETAFNTDCFIPGNYRLGCWLYDREFKYGLRNGFYKKNPKFTRKSNHPMYIES